MKGKKTKKRYTISCRAVSSVGRASALQAECHWFESNTAQCVFLHF